MATIVNDNLRKVLKLCGYMLELSDLGDKYREDAGCGAVYGALRDQAYKLRQLAESELDLHNRRSTQSLAGKRKQDDR